MIESPASNESPPPTPRCLKKVTPNNLRTKERWDEILIKGMGEERLTGKLKQHYFLRNRLRLIRLMCSGDMNRSTNEESMVLVKVVRRR